jgi:hypothetical protein
MLKVVSGQRDAQGARTHLLVSSDVAIDFFLFLFFVQQVLKVMSGQADAQGARTHVLASRCSLALLVQTCLSTGTRIQILTLARMCLLPGAHSLYWYKSVCLLVQEYRY